MYRNLSTDDGKENADRSDDGEKRGELATMNDPKEPPCAPGHVE